MPPFWCASPSLRTSYRAIDAGVLVIVGNVRHLDDDDLFDLRPSLRFRVARPRPIVAGELVEANGSADHSKVVRNSSKTFQRDMVVDCCEVARLRTIVSTRLMMRATQRTRYVLAVYNVFFQYFNANFRDVFRSNGQTARTKYRGVIELARYAVLWRHVILHTLGPWKRKKVGQQRI